MFINLLHPRASVTNQYKLVPATAGR